MNIRLVAGALIVAVLITACISFGMSALGNAQEAPELKGHFAGQTISFDYPTSWERHSYTKVSSFSTAIVFLSNQQMQPPCVTTRTGHGADTRCGWPVEQVKPGGVVIEWSSDGWLGTVDGKGPGGTTIAGRPANVNEKAPGNCKHLAGDLQIIAAVATDDAGSSWIEMNACLRGPGLEEQRAYVYDMLASLQVQDLPPFLTTD